jgi:hypothetical protein
MARRGGGSNVASSPSGEWVSLSLLLRATRHHGLWLSRIWQLAFQARLGMVECRWWYSGMDGRVIIWQVPKGTEKKRMGEEAALGEGRKPGRRKEALSQPSTRRMMDGSVGKTTGWRSSLYGPDDILATPRAAWSLLGMGCQDAAHWARSACEHARRKNPAGCTVRPRGRSMSLHRASRAAQAPHRPRLVTDPIQSLTVLGSDGHPETDLRWRLEMSETFSRF